MRKRLTFRLDAAIANTPVWLAAATCMALVLFVSAAATFRGARSTENTAWRSLPDRALEVAAALERHGASDRASVSAWLDLVRRQSNGQIAWLRVLDTDGGAEASSGAVVVRVEWDRDERIRAGQHSHRVVKTTMGTVAVAAVPITIRNRHGNGQIRLASFGGRAGETELLEMGAPIAAGEASRQPREWVNLIGAGLLFSMLAVATGRRAMLID